MKNIHKYIMFFVMAFAIASCTEEEIVENKIVGKPGEEVKFSLSLDNGSRTIYGPEVEYENNEGTPVHAFPIYWVDGDKVQIFSPQCLEGGRNAEYVVSTKDDEGNVVTNQNYASNLAKTGANGVQWGKGYTEDGNTGLHDFYSIYPSGNYTFNSDASGNVLASGVKVNAKQTVYYEGTGVNSQNNGFVYDMSNCLMYAYTPKVDIDDDNVVVNLSYNPLSTVLWVEMKAADAPEKPTTADQIKNFKIFGITLTSSKANIAGDFILNVGDGSLHSWTSPTSGTTNIDITLRDKNLGEQENYTLNAGQTVKFPVFIAPVSNWDNSVLKIAINTDQGTFTKTITSNSSSLKPGKIHKIKLPELNVNNAEEWDVATWMRYIPRNVYLSEISIPGSWNTINSDYQNKTAILDQYNIGVRAFHFDTRWRTSDTESNILGYLSGDINGLSVAGGAASDNYKSTSGGRVVSGNAKTFAGYLKDITDNVKSDEYMVLMCTFAQDSHEYSGDHGDWAGEISYQCSLNSAVYDAKQLTENTLVGDVLNKVIVIINMEGSFTEVPSDSKCLFVNMPLTLTSDLFSSSLTAKNSGPIYKGTSGSASASKTNIEMYHTQAQISLEGDTYTSSYQRNEVMKRGFAPTFGERKTVASNILEWSKNNYRTDNYEHDIWIYLGLGGYYAEATYNWLGNQNGWTEKKGSNATVAYDFNTWINGKVTEMGNETTNIPYYPVGIVLMNFTNDYAGTVKNILTLNNKYGLQYDSSKPSYYTPTQTAQVVSKANYDSTVNDGGNVISLD